MRSVKLRWFRKRTEEMVYDLITVFEFELTEEQIQQQKIREEKEATRTLEKKLKGEAQNKGKKKQQ